MKILLISIGTRGDVEPFLAVGQQMQSLGHDVHTAFPEQYSYLAEESNLKCYPLCKGFIELIEGEDAKMIMGGKISGLKKVAAYYKMYKKSTTVNRKILLEQHQLINDLVPDKVVYSGKAVYPILWSKDNPGKTILLSPVPCLIHAVKHLPHLGFHNSLGRLNGLTYKLANWGLAATIRSVSKILDSTKNISKNEILKLVKSAKMIYAISPELFPRPNYWPSHVKVLGYQERAKASNYVPEKTLANFIEEHKKVMFVSFGSMENPNPIEKTKIILNTLSELKIPAIINCAEGGLVQPEQFDTKQFYFVNRIPYDWILPQVYAVMHHGGSGTTHLTVKYGCASLIIPHIIDQFLWNNVISIKGLGSKGVSVQKLSYKKLKPLVDEVWNNTSYKKRAIEAGRKMREEDFSKQVAEMIVGN